MLITGHCVDDWRKVSKEGKRVNKCKNKNNIVGAINYLYVRKTKMKESIFEIAY